MGSYKHMCTDKEYLLRTINLHLKKYDNNFYSVNIMVGKNKKDQHPVMPTKYDELIDLLKDYDKVYEFYEFDSLRRGVKCYDIILEE